MIRRILSDVIFLTIDGATIGTYRGEIFSWANLVGVNSTQTTYKVSGGIRQQFFVVQMRSEKLMKDVQLCWLEMATLLSKHY